MDGYCVPKCKTSWGETYPSVVMGRHLDGRQPLTLTPTLSQTPTLTLTLTLSLSLSLSLTR